MKQLDIGFGLLNILSTNIWAEPTVLIDFFLAAQRVKTRCYKMDRGYAPFLLLVLQKGHRPDRYCNRGFQPTVIKQPPIECHRHGSYFDYNKNRLKQLLPVYNPLTPPDITNFITSAAFLSMGFTLSAAMMTTWPAKESE